MGELLSSLGIGKGAGGLTPPMTSPPLVNQILGPTASTPGEMGGTPVGPTGADDVVVGDGWKPRKPTILGAIADGYLVSKGMKPMFSQQRDARSIQEALQGFSQNPQQAINRLMRIPGQENNALGLLDKYQDNKRADLTAESLAESRKEKFFPRVGGMLRAISRSKDPVAAYKQQRPIIQRYIEGRGLENDIQLPDEWDETAIDNIVMGNVSPEDQIKIDALQEYRQQRLGLDKQKAEDLNNYRQERLEDFDQAEAGRNNRATATEAGKDRRSTTGRANPKSRAGKVYRGPNGSLVEYNNSGTGMKVTHPSGKIFYYKMDLNGKPVKVGEE